LSLQLFLLLIQPQLEPLEYSQESHLAQSSYCD
jgi:hypothetical protein